MNFKSPSGGSAQNTAVYLPNGLLREKKLMMEINWISCNCISHLFSSASFLRLWGHSSVWSSPHEVWIWRKTGEDLPVVLQVKLHTTEAKWQWTKAFSLACHFYGLFMVFFFSSPESKKDFLRAVHSILREKQRRQLLKTESLPQNQQYVPFGGKRLCALKGARPAMNRAGDRAWICSAV